VEQLECYKNALIKLKERLELLDRKGDNLISQIRALTGEEMDARDPATLTVSQQWELSILFAKAKANSEEIENCYRKAMAIVKQINLMVDLNS
jgi:hypothetical protein